MSWCDLTHADLVAGLRGLLTTNPLPSPRVIYATPDGRERTRLPQARQAADGRAHVGSSGDDVRHARKGTPSAATYSEVTW